MDEIRTVLCNLPTTIGGYTVLDNEGFYTIVLNSNLSRERNEESYYHELSHIKNGDYEKKSNVSILEMFAHRQ